MSVVTLLLLAYLALQIGVMARALAVAGRQPESRAAWLVVLWFLPGLGIALYLLLGEPWMSRRMQRKVAAARLQMLSQTGHQAARLPEQIPERFRATFRTCMRLVRGPVTWISQARLTADSRDAIRQMVEDIDAASVSAHVLFYIWLTDDSGQRMAAALADAAERGVACRVIVDAIGSRKLLRSPLWQRMEAAGVKLCASLRPLPGMRVLGNRMDLRNHRKIVVIDNRITWCGSQNVADPEFLIKARYGPWVDLMLRFEGSIALQNQQLFVRNWVVEHGEELPVPRLPDTRPADGPDSVPAVAFGTGPWGLRRAMSDVYVTLLGAAHDEVVITNPYFVPDHALFAALVACAHRGVAVTLILPKRNDSRIVGTISKASYLELLEAGIRIHEFPHGLLHAKTLVVDGQVALIGSANMDRRSMELNFENSILLCSTRIAGQIRACQDDWLAQSHEVHLAQVQSRLLPRRIYDNLVTILSPLA